MKPVLSQSQSSLTDISATQSAARLSKEKIRLEFHIMESGGAIDFRTKDPRDISTHDALGAYGTVLQEQLRKGNFDLLFSIVLPSPEFVDSVRKNGGVGFSVIEGPSGITLDVTCSSQQSRTAVHEFIRRARGNTPFTAEEKRMNHPGNNLGWDAQRDSDLSK